MGWRDIPRDTPLVVATSYGNDSCALIQYLHELESIHRNGFTNVTLLYNDTGWAASWWPMRVDRMETWAMGLGFWPERTQSIGMKQLVRDHRGWPRHGMQFCTEDLKIAPTLAWLDVFDPERRAICVTGVRQAESERRSKVEEFEPFSALHGNRLVWRPIYKHDDAQRDELLRRADIRVLPHRSRECSPCINEGRKDLVQVEEERIGEIADLEGELGYTKKGAPRVMFRPAKKKGATGIREVMDWAHSEPGKYAGGSGLKGNVDLDDEPVGDCGDLGYCGV